VSADTQEPDDDRPFRLPPDVLRSVNEAIGKLNRSVLPALSNVRLPVRVPRIQLPQIQLPGLDSVLDQLRLSVVPIVNNPQILEAVRQLGATVERYYPLNWTDVDVDPDAALNVAQTEGLPLVWAPRGELVKKLLDAADATTRRQLLQTHAGDIIADCGAVVADVTEQTLREHKARLVDAIRAHEAGLHAPAQAMSAVVITALLQWVYAHQELRNVKASPLRAPQQPDDLGFRLFKVAVLIEAAVPAVQGGRDKLSDKALVQFNRHDTLHRVADEAYELPNAMTALLLATGLLAEAQQMLEDGTLTT
jgi:hypothetical protein